MARRGGIRARLAPVDLVVELRRWIADGVPPNRWGLPPDQIALVSLAASKIAPTILRTQGVAETPETRTLVEGVLLTMWANALLTLDGETIWRLAEETGRPEG